MAGGQSNENAADRAMVALALAAEHEPALTPEALELLSVSGIMNALAKVLLGFQSGGDRDEIAALNGEHKTIKLAVDVLGNLLGHQIHHANGKKLDQILSDLGRRDSGGTTSFDDFDPPEADTGAH